MKVHQSVLDYGVKITGATAHFVMKVLIQAHNITKAVEVYEDDDAVSFKASVRGRT